MQVFHSMSVSRAATTWIYALKKNQVELNIASFFLIVVKLSLCLFCVHKELNDDQFLLTLRQGWILKGSDFLFFKELSYIHGVPTQMFLL